MAVSPSTQAAQGSYCRQDHPNEENRGTGCTKQRESGRFHAEVATEDRDMKIEPGRWVPLWFVVPEVAFPPVAENPDTARRCRKEERQNEQNPGSPSEEMGGHTTIIPDGRTIRTRRPWACRAIAFSGRPYSGVCCPASACESPPPGIRFPPEPPRRKEERLCQRK